MISRLTCVLSLSLLLSILAFGRQAQSPVSDNRESMLGSVTFGLKFSHYSPKVDNISSAFDGVEDTLGLPRGPRFDITYLAGANLRYTINSRHTVSVELGVNLSKGTLQGAESIERIYSLGLQYYYSLQNRKRDFYGLDVGAGAGWLVANFERNYNDERISVLKKSVNVNGSLLGWVSPASSVYLELEARYMFVPNIAVDYPQATMKLSSLLLGVGVAIGL